MDVQPVVKLLEKLTHYTKEKDEVCASVLPPAYACVLYVTCSVDNPTS